jgi:hypothetical protein
MWEVLDALGAMWDPLIAIGTIALSMATFWLARRTSNLAGTSAADLQAQWRPIVVPSFHPVLGDPADYNSSDGTLGVRIRNGGRGPALYLRTELDPIGPTARQGPLASLAVGDEQVLRFEGVKPDSHAQLLLDYRDLAGRAYSTSITLEVGGNGALAAYDVHLFEGRVTHHGDSVYPQKGLRDVTPKVRRPLKARALEAGRVLRGKSQVAQES